MKTSSGTSKTDPRRRDTDERKPLRIRSRWAVLGLSMLTALLLSLIFAPVNCWPLSYVCMVPWLLAVCTAERQGWLYASSYVAGFIFFFLNLHWLWDVAFIEALGVRWPAGTFAMAVYLAVYFPLSAWPVHHACVRWRLPAAIVFPVVWVANEMLRAWVMTGFPWFFLSHSHYRVLALIQVSDLVGAYGVTFVIAMVNGCAADLLLGWLLVRRHPWRIRRRMVRASVVVTVLGVAATIAYGRYRLATIALAEGPRVAVIQEDYPLEVLDEGEGPSAFEKLAAHLRLAIQAAHDEPDILAFPETAWGDVLNPDFLEAKQLIAGYVGRARQLYSRRTDAILRALARGDERALVTHLEALGIGMGDANGLSPTYVLVGSMAYELFPTAVYPKIKRYNSAYLYESTGREEPDRYDKVHLVLFGEFVPFRDGRLHLLYQSLNSITPWGRSGSEYSLTAGSQFKVLTMRANSQNGRTYRFGVPICYEDCMPYVCRAFVGQGHEAKQADFLLNISNDGWFHHGAEHMQHLAICVFRAVENRVAIARAVNTGVSAFIDPVGRVHGMIDEGETGYLVRTLKLSDRFAPYTRWGDWFAMMCGLLVAAVLAESVIARLRRWWKLHRSADQAGATQSG
ncbi:MAG TPA: nitrilase-related carbon-nitrogen hydrolase [Phycisphaerae bacterium]|nr:nitrilase-related carbon-nitrogen hydrolase [Phycisphaerae bacterium]